MKKAHFNIIRNRVSFGLILYFFYHFNIIAQFEKQTDIHLIGLTNCSVAMGDFNNDDFLDIITMGDSLNAKPIILYKNNGNQTFSKLTNLNFQGLSFGAISCMDYNNDGWLDFVISGDSAYNSTPITKFFKNNGNDSFEEQVNLKLPGVMYGSISCVDYDNNGLTDLILIGKYGRSRTLRTFKNNGDGTYLETIIDFKENSDLQEEIIGDFHYSISIGDYNNDGFFDLLTSIGLYKNNADGTFSKLDFKFKGGESVEWGDYNNDGWTDILTSNYSNTKIFKNNEGKSFNEITISSTINAQRGAYQWLDYNNDGLLDIINIFSFSYWNNNQLTKIYKNNGDGTFTELSTSIQPTSFGSLAFGDYDNDGKTDIILTGNKQIFIYKNISSSINSPPTIPNNLSSIVNFNQVNLKWDKATDIQTPQNGLTYNLKIGTNPGSFNIISPMSSIQNGFRRIVAIGNAGSTVDSKILNLPKGNYYWSVQAIDNNLSGSPWSEEASFTIDSTQVSNFFADSISLNAIRLRWDKGNGAKCLIFMTEGNKPPIIPEQNTHYEANENFGVGSQINLSEWFCVYNGSENKTLVTGLKSGIEYKIEIFEYLDRTESYNTEISSENIILFKTKQLFEEQSHIFLIKPVQVASWGDYNSDGLLDLLVAGSDGTSRTVLYQNKLNSMFYPEKKVQLISVGNDCSVSWGDYNNDNYPDIILSGWASMVGYGGYRTKIYKNNNENFVGLPFDPMLRHNKCIWLDYDNDGLKDILFSLKTESRIYKNYGNDNFENQLSINSGGTSITGDYNNDGYTDILIDTVLFKNNGNGTFSSQEQIKLNLGSGRLSDYDGNGYFEMYPGSLADYNSDGFLDIFVGTNLYKNCGDETFTRVLATTFIYGRSAWGDYNNDGKLDLLIDSILYKNEGSDTFCQVNEVKLPKGVTYWADYNNDGYIDILIGNKIFKNNGAFVPMPKNTSPSEPTNLRHNIERDKLILSWDKATDKETPQNGLSYNVRVGTTPNGTDIVSPSSNITNGFLFILSPENSKLKTSSYKLNYLRNGTYYWSVQAIDDNFSGGTWSKEQSFQYSSSSNSINELNSDGIIDLFPNPARGFIHITKKNYDASQISIIDMNGKIIIDKIITKNNETISIQELSEGIYIVKIQTNKIINFFKLIKD